MSWRYRLILLCFFLIFILIDLRLYYWQFVRAEELSSMGHDQYGAEVIITPDRGSIRTSDGYSIAANKISYLLYANPKVIEDRDDISDKLSPLLNTESASISGILKKDSFWVPLKSGIDESLKLKIEALKIDGLGFEKQPERIYPEASMAAKLLGFVGKDENGRPQGYFGLEGYYERQLKGKEGLAIRVRDAWGNPIPDKLNEYTLKVDGRSLDLHIDRVIQYIAEEELKNGLIKYGAESGMVGIMDPKTGGILAMSAFPSFDPSNYSEFTQELYKNPFISDTYEPGSTFKPLIMASAIDSGVLSFDTPCDICGGPVEIDGYSIKTWNDEYRPDSTMTDVIKHSDNTGMVFVGRKLGLDRMIDYLQKFGLDSATGIDLQGEASPSIRPKENWYRIDLATASFGQGIIITPVQLLSAFSALANEGKRMEPHVVRSIQTSDGQIIEIPPKTVGSPVSSKTSKILTEMLVNAVDSGEAKWAKPKGYRIAGKTGTAQIALAGHYDPDKTIASFIGFAPADDPKFVMLVVYNKPSTSIYGSETAAPVFFNIAKKLLAYYDIPPTEPVSNISKPVKEPEAKIEEPEFEVSATQDASESAGL